MWQMYKFGFYEKLLLHQLDRREVDAPSRTPIRASSGRCWVTSRGEPITEGLSGKPVRASAVKNIR